MSPPSTAPPNFHAQCCPQTSRATRCQRIVSRMEFMKANDSGSSAIKPQRRVASTSKRKQSMSSLQDIAHGHKKQRSDTSTPSSTSGTESGKVSMLSWMAGSEDSDDSDSENEDESDSSNTSSTKPRCPSLNNNSGSETSSCEDEYTPSTSDESDSDSSEDSDTLSARGQYVARRMREKKRVTERRR